MTDDLHRLRYRTHLSLHFIRFIVMAASRVTAGVAFTAAFTIFELQTDGNKCRVSRYQHFCWPWPGSARFVEGGSKLNVCRDHAVWFVVKFRNILMEKEGYDEKYPQSFTLSLS